MNKCARIIQAYKYSVDVKSAGWSMKVGQSWTLTPKTKNDVIAGNKW